MAMKSCERFRDYFCRLIVEDLYRYHLNMFYAEFIFVGKLSAVRQSQGEKMPVEGES